MKLQTLAQTHHSVAFPPLTMQHSFLFLVSVTLILLLVVMGEAPPQSTLGLPARRYEYSTVTGYFMQDDPGTDGNTFDYVCDMSRSSPIIYSMLTDGPVEA